MALNQGGAVARGATRVREKGRHCETTLHERVDVSEPKDLKATGDRGEQVVNEWLREQDYGNVRTILQRIGANSVGSIDVRWLNEHGESYLDDFHVYVGNTIAFRVEVKASEKNHGFTLSPKQWKLARTLRAAYVVIYVPFTYADDWRHCLLVLELQPLLVLQTRTLYPTP